MLVQNKIKNKEIKSLTGIRGIAALVVAIHHFISKYYIGYFEEKASNSWVDYVSFNYANHGYLMVEMFFILSGFVLALSYNTRFENKISVGDYKQFMIKRFNRVYPLYFFSTIVYFFIFNLDKILNVDILLANFLFMELWLPKFYSLNNVSWSLCAEWFLYLIFPFMLVKSRLFNNNIILLLSTAIVVFIFAPILNTQKIYDEGVYYSIFELRMSNGTGAFLRCIGSYIVGIAIYYIYINKQNVVKILSEYWYVVLGLIMIFYGIDKTDIILDILFGLLILALTQVNRLSIIFSSKILYFLGLISYSIYLNHMIFLRLLNFSFKKTIWVENELNVFCGFLLFLFMTILSAWFTYKYIEVPFGKWLNKRLFN